MISKILGGFSFHAQWNAGVIFFSFLLIVLYLFLLPTSKNHPWYKSVAFICSMLLIMLTVGSPLNLLGRILFRAHIVQMIMLLLIAAPLLVMGLKISFLMRMNGNRIGKRVYRMVTSPITAIVLFHSLFLLYHVPSIFDWVRTGYFTNYFFLIGLVVAGILLWWPLIAPIKEADRLTCNQKRLYVLVNFLLFVPISMYLLLSNQVLYSVYSDTDLMLSALELCMPVGEEIPPDLVTTLLPFPPLTEQKNGAILLIGSVASIFTLNLVIVSIINSRRDSKGEK